MTSLRICARFRPLSSKEREEHGDKVCIQCMDSETFLFKDEKDEELSFRFDKVFYENSHQAEIYQFLALPIVRGAVGGTNGTIITCGQAGAGKTYSLEGPCMDDLQERGLLPRVVEGLFGCIKSSGGTINRPVKLSMVEIYNENVRDLFDLAKVDMQIEESKSQGIVLTGVTEISVSDPAEALQSLASGIANRAVGETQMNMASSRSHCIYIFTVQQEVKKDGRLKTSKLILVDLAGSEKVETTGAEGKVLEEARASNKSLLLLGNAIDAVTCGSSGKANHFPLGDSKRTGILQLLLGGNSQTALLCCCSPSPSDAMESLSTLRLGMRAKHVRWSAPSFHYEGDEILEDLRYLFTQPYSYSSCCFIPRAVRDRSRGIVRQPFMITDPDPPFLVDLSGSGIQKELDPPEPPFLVDVKGSEQYLDVVHYLENLP